jgi:hypothetical protein
LSASTIALLIADHPHFPEIDTDRQRFRDIADVWSLVRPDRILLPITRSAAVTTSLEAGELTVGMITSLVPHGTPGGRRQQVEVTHERSGASAVDRIHPQARGAKDEKQAGKRRAKKPQPTPAELEAALDDLTREATQSG